MTLEDRAARVQQIQGHTREISAEFFRPIDGTNKPMLDFAIGFEKMPINKFGGFSFVQDSNGAYHRISINERSADRSMWELLEVTTHQLAHVYISEVRGHVDTHSYHTREYVELMRDIGINVKPEHGYHLSPALGRFTALMERLGVEKPQAVIDAENGEFILPTGTKNWWDVDKKKEEGKSTLYLYTTKECPEDPKCKIRIGRQNFHPVMCMSCKGVFEREGVKPRDTRVEDLDIPDYTREQIERISALENIPYLDLGIHPGTRTYRHGWIDPETGKKYGVKTGRDLRTNEEVSILTETNS